MTEILDLLNRAATLIYNFEGDTYQNAYEQLEAIIDQLEATK
jgi:hypothetical protein